nr:MAG TPA: hypothetical protein [Bacteriophage sp.]
MVRGVDLEMICVLLDRMLLFGMARTCRWQAISQAASSLIDAMLWI